MNLRGLVKASLSTLATAGPGKGKLNTMFERVLGKVVENITDLPGDNSARKITIEMEFKPSAQRGSVDSVELGFTVKYKLVGEHATLHMVPHAGSQLLFNPESADNARQATLDQADEESGN